MPRSGIRFFPPPLACPAELQWVILAAFGPEAPPLTADLSPAVIVEHAIKFDLASRLVMKLGRHRITRLLGEPGKFLVSAVFVALANQEKALAGVPDIAGIAFRCGHSVVVLKSAALIIGGDSRPGSRNAGDFDVLVPESAAHTFHRALQKEGWHQVGGDEGEADHALPLLAHPIYGRLEVHWCFVGVDLAGTGRSGSFRDAAELGLLRRREGYPQNLFLPSRDLSAAYAVVHGIAQHGFIIDYSYFRIPADLIDLGFGRQGPPAELLSWISRSLSPEESMALFGLATRLESGDTSLFEGFERSSTGEGLLLRHFVAAGLVPDYKESMRIPAAMLVISEAPRASTLVRRLWQTIVPSARQLEKLYGPSRHYVSPILWRCVHPLKLGFRLVRYGLKRLFPESTAV